MKHALLILGLVAGQALAAPGAHGPGGEHLDAPAAGAAPSTTPKLQTQSESFELVATLAGGELSILVDRFETNEPVLNARVEVESGPRKAIAKFHADHGDYSVDDKAFLEALLRPGEHPLVFTLVAGKESDLLEGTLKVNSPDTHAGDDHPRMPVWGWAAVGALLIGAVVAVMRRRSRREGVLS